MARSVRHHGDMKFRLSLLVFCFALTLQAQMQMNVEQLVEFVRSELALKQQSDKQIAAYLRQKVQLTEKLTDKTILDLEAQGAGPKTVQALQDLRDRTGSLKPPTHDATYSPATSPDNTLTSGPPTAILSSAAPPMPPPNSVRQQQILDHIREYAMSYTQNLPNFVCVEVIRRSVDPYASDHYRSIGNVMARVSYNEGQENYQVYSVNGHYEETTIEHAAGNGGAISTGEFGSMMREIFERRSEAEFGWDHWARLRGKLVAVFNFFVDSGHSSYSIAYSSGPGDEQRIITAYRGLIYADQETGRIDRIKFVAVDIPRTFPVSEATEILDYDEVEISGEPYICPLMAVLYMSAGREKSKNVIEFRNYRKFDIGSVITYGKSETPSSEVPAPLPESKAEEQPAAAASQATTGEATKQTSKPAATNSNNGSNPWWAMPVPPPPPTTQPPQ
jgi:hypothetical protein